MQGGCLGLQGIALEAVDLALGGLIQHRSPDGDVPHPSVRIWGPELVTSSAWEWGERCRKGNQNRGMET